MAVQFHKLVAGLAQVKSTKKVNNDQFQYKAKSGAVGK
jgi:hypothetical protein